MLEMNKNTNKIATRLSEVEATQGRPVAKRRRITATSTKNDDHSDLFEAEGPACDSEILTVDYSKDGAAPTNSNTSAAEDELLSEIAQDYAEKEKTIPNVSQKLAEIVINVGHPSWVNQS